MQHMPNAKQKRIIAILAALITAPLLAADQFEIAKFVGDDPGANRQFGYAVSLRAGEVIVGARYDVSGSNVPGVVYFFTGSGASWTQAQTQTNSDGVDWDRFGDSLSVSGNDILVGAFGNDDAGTWSGSAYFLSFNGSLWTNEQKVTASDAATNDQFGAAVAIDGEYAIIGALGDDPKGSDSGSVYLYARSTGTWTQQTKAFPADGAANDNFASWVDLEGIYALIGAPGDDSATGSAYVFTRGGTSLNEQAKLTAADRVTGDEFGICVALAGDLAAIGAPGDNTDTGAVYVFQRTGTTWTEVDKLIADDAATGDRFGESVAIVGETIAIGAPGQSAGAGAAYIFTSTSTVWTQRDRLLASDAQPNDDLGHSIAIDGQYVLVGGIQNASKPGAAYLFNAPGFDCNNNAVPDICDVSCAATNPETGNVCSLDYPFPACGTLPDCNGNSLPDSCDADCNSNGIADDCDITDGASLDCDSNGIPDECDTDCDSNGIPDACDITTDPTTDCDGNGALDACEIHQSLTALSANFSTGLPSGWSAAGLWHTTSQCAVTPTCGGASSWAYFGQDTGCTFDTGSATSGTLTAPPVTVASDATSVTLQFCSAYDAEGRDAPNGFDAAWVAVDGVIVDDVGSTGLLGAWEMRTVDLSAYAGQTITLSWNFDSIDTNRNDTLGWQVTAISLTVDTGASNDCNTNGILDACDIADGVSSDCDFNGAPDECEIAAGTSNDCNANLIPDACEATADCDNNGTPDICEDQIVYVDASASGLADGTSWGDAFTDLQAALTDATTYCIGAEVWVAQGVYKPASAGGSRSATFQLVDNVAIYGGFSGTEVSLGERDIDPTQNNTVLSGDLSGNDTVGGGRADNAYHVVTGSGTTASAVLDGFTIRSGNADGPYPDQLGAGLFISQGNPTLRNCRVIDNDSLTGGAYISRSSPVLSRCIFENNRSQSAGAIYIVTDSAPSLLHCAFVGNSATNAGNGFGGAVFGSGNADAVFVNCVFSGNTADSVGGAVYAQTSTTLMSFVNCTFSQNDAGAFGGGVAAFSSSTIDFANTIFWSNTVGTSRNEDTQIHLDGGGTVTLDHCLVDGLTGTLGGSGNFDADPVFVDADGTDNIVGTNDDNLRLSPGSPAIDAGNNVAYNIAIYGAFDLGALPRILDDPDVTDTGTDTGTGTQPIIDLGAYERQTDCNTNGIPDATDITAGTSQDCTGNTTPDECETDCNNNGIADSCDIQNDPAIDCNANGTPDSCELATGATGATDCNSNGIIDSCDIASGTSSDCDGSGIPDSCKTDCNTDGTPDSCEDFSSVLEISDQLFPIAATTPQSYTITASGKAFTDVTLTFIAVADVDAADEFIAVDLNGTALGDIFATGTGDGCAAVSQDQIVLAAAAFNVAVGNAPAVITMTPTATVANICTPTSYIVVSVKYDPVGDCNSNGIPDDCDIAGGAETDQNTNGIPDSCEDCNANGTADDLDLAAGTSTDLNSNGLPDECEDCNGNSLPDACDISCGATQGPCDWAGCGLIADSNANGVPDDCEDCNGNAILDTDDVASGTSPDCNANQIPDECEIDPASGAPGGPYYCTTNCATDCNVNGLIDGCEISAGTASDCNTNAIPDVCDIASGTSFDCNTNGVPDTCAIEPDGDGDGTIDDCDLCPADANKTSPGICGCQVPDDDTDSDGVADCLDNCPSTPPLITVDANGCPLIGGCCLGLGLCLDSLDQATCEALSGGVYLGNGATCATDSDGDMVADCDELCPNDPLKTSPGACGCGASDMDTDTDGVANCLDLCANTPGGDAVDSNGCSLYGACCVLGVGCFDGSETITEAFCISPLGGTYQGNGSACADGCAYGVVGDFDGDGDVDLEDYAIFAGCLGSPKEATVFVLPSIQCRTVFDFDGDNDIDLVDFSAFQRVRTN